MKGGPHIGSCLMVGVEPLRWSGWLLLKAITSHHWGPGSIPGHRHVRWFSPMPQGFFSRTYAFPPSGKIIKHFQSLAKLRGHNDPHCPSFGMPASPCWDFPSHFVGMEALLGLTRVRLRVPSNSILSHITRGLSRLQGKGPSGKTWVNVARCQRRPFIPKAQTLFSRILRNWASQPWAKMISLPN